MSITTADDDFLSSLAGQKGRKAQPSRYVDQVREAFESGATNVIVPVTEEYKPANIRGHLDKAAKELGLKVRQDYEIWDRSDEQYHGISDGTRTYPLGLMALRFHRGE